MSTPPSKRTLGLMAVLAAGLLLVVGPPAESAKKKKPKKAEDLTNVFLSPEWSQWLVGPVVLIATDEEVTEYLSLTDDAAASRFVDEFWTKRDPEPDWRGGGLRQTFDDRAAEADKRFSEAAYSGRRTDRGAIYILYGEPTQISYEVTRDQRRLQIEHWYYSENVANGLDGNPPGRHYWFAKQGDLTKRVAPPRKLSREPALPISQQ